jgi:hypothetical protein
MPRGAFDCPAAKASITINGSMWLGVTHFSRQNFVAVGTTVSAQADKYGNCGDDGDQTPRRSAETVAQHSIAIVI